MADSNCPNCGAPITGPSCLFCGTQFGGAFPVTVHVAADGEIEAVVRRMVERGLLSCNEARRLGNV